MTNFSLIVQKTQRCFQNWGTPGSGEPRRSTEELRVIYNDLLEFRDTQNSLHEIGTLMPTPMNGKTWEEEKADFYNKGMNSYTDLIRSGEVKSCEILTLCQGLTLEVQGRKNREGVWNHIGYQFYSSSEYDFGNQGHTLDEMILALEEVTTGIATRQKIEVVNDILDSIGTSACEPRAMIDTDTHEFKDYQNVSLPDTRLVKSSFHSIT